MPTSKVLPSEKILFLNGYGFFEGMKYGEKDIAMLADMRRAGIHSNSIQLIGRDLEEFVIRCLKVPEYQVLGIPATAQELMQVTEN